MVELGEVCEINPKKSELKGLDDDLDVSFIPMSEMNQGTSYLNARQTKKLREVLTGYTYFKNSDVLLAKITPCFENGKSGIARELKNGIGFGSTEFIVIRPDLNRILPEIIYHFVSESKFLTEGTPNMTGSAGQQRLSLDFVKRHLIPLPPLEVQEKIVAELDGYQKIIDGAKQVVENYKPTIKIDPDWPMVELGKICENHDSQRIPIEKGKRKAGDFPYYGASGIVDYVDNYIFDGDYLLISEDGANLLARTTPIAFSVSGKIWVNNHAHILHFTNIATQIFAEYYLNEMNLDDYITGSAQPKLSQQNLNRIRIPIPSLEIQEMIVAEIKSERELVEANKKLIEIYEKKIKDKIGEIWGE